MLVTGRVESIQIGRIQTFERQGKKAYTSAIIKTPVSSGVTVESEGIVGDQQADRKHHGGRDKAILSYTTESLAFWQSEFPELIWTSGAFGENLTLSGLSETDVCIGDIFEVGEVTLQITQPREPCWKLSERWQLPKLAVRVQQTRRTGWYLRVLRGGVLHPGQTLQLIDRPHPSVTVTHANDVLFAKPRCADADQKLADCDALSDAWKQTLRRRSSRSSS